jgi:hypothetical protein
LSRIAEGGVVSATGPVVTIGCVTVTGVVTAAGAIVTIGCVTVTGVVSATGPVVTIGCVTVTGVVSTARAIVASSAVAVSAVAIIIIIDTGDVVVGVVLAEYPVVTLITYIDRVDRRRITRIGYRSDPASDGEARYEDPYR